MSRQLALVPIAKPYSHHLAFAKFRDVAAAQGFHMYEYVRRARAARHKTIALGAIEPFDDSVKNRPAGFGDTALWPFPKCRHRLGSGIVQGDDSQCLQAARAGHDFTDHSCAFANRFKSGMPDAALMQQDIRAAIERLHKAIALGAVEPFDMTGDANSIHAIERLWQAPGT